MKREYNVVIERDSEGFYGASLPELHGCHTQARSLDRMPPYPGTAARGRAASPANFHLPSATAEPLRADIPDTGNRGFT